MMETLVHKHQCQVRALYMYMCMCFTCACMILKVHRSGGGLGEETVEISGSESTRQTAQELIEDIINSQETRGK